MWDLNTVTDWANILGFLCPLAVSVYAIWRRIDKRQVETHIATVRINDKLDFIEKQFGNNGGGMREAINNMSAKVDVIERRVNAIDRSLAEVSGKFEQHVVEADR